MLACGSSTSSPAITYQPTAADLLSVKTAISKSLPGSAAFTFRSDNAPGLGGSATGTGSFDFVRSTGTLSLVLGQNLGPEELIFTPQSAFLKTGRAGSGGQQWLAAGLDPGDAPDSYKALVLQAEALDPAFILAELKYGLVTASRTVSSSSGNASKTTYAAVVDLSRAAKGLTAAAMSGYASGVTTESSTPGRNELNVDVTLDSQGNLLTLSMSPPNTDLGQITFSFTKFGVSVTAPTPAPKDTQVISAPQPGAEPSSEPSAK
jgi:hypothetical protein